MIDRPITLTERQMEEIANRAAEKALQTVYLEVGKSVVKKAMWIIGCATLALLYWFNHGKLP